MGDIKRFRKKYQTPAHPWNKVRLDAERILEKEYGLKSKKEQWKMISLLKGYKDQAKKLISITTPQGKKEMQMLTDKLIRLGLLKAGAQLDDILSLTISDLMERRLQTILFRKGMANTQKQARQFIVHRHVAIGDDERTFPSYLVSLEEEPKITFRPRSSLSNADHAERSRAQQKEMKKVSKAEKKKEPTTEEPVPEEQLPLAEEA